MPDFTLDDLEPDISPSGRDIICDVVLSWARLDSLVSQLVLTAFGLAVDGGTILLGQMDTRTKLDRLKRLYDHHGMTDAAQSISNLRAWHKKHVDVRNTIAHHTCAGSWRSDPSMIVFAPRPIFAAPIYAVQSMTSPLAHGGSRDMLLGPNSSLEMQREHSPAHHVTRTTPAFFMAHTEDDATVPVENTLEMRAALKAAGVMVETHLFAAGGHGFGLPGPRGDPARHWKEMFISWAQSLGLG